jgi:hypothetical protein
MSRPHIRGAMRPYPPNILIRILEQGALESLLRKSTPGLSPEHLTYAGTLDRIKEVQSTKSGISYLLRRSPWDWPHTAITPVGRRLTVNVADRPHVRLVEYQGRPLALGHIPESGAFDPCRLYVGGVPYEMTDTALLKVFTKFGTVQAVSIVLDRMMGMRSKGFGFVRMSSDGDAKTAIEALNREEVLENGEYVSAYTTPVVAKGDETYDRQSSVMTIVETMSRELARLVCYEPGKLQQLEWRDLERMLAAVLDGLGYAVRLTRPAKDGGKDIIVEFVASQQKLSYYVEVKHWVSGQRVGSKTVREFLSVIVRDQQRGGILISTSGFSASAMQGITEIERKRLRLGDSDTVVSLCRTYLNVSRGLVYPVNYTDMLISVTRDGVEPDESS